MSYQTRRAERIAKIVSEVCKRIDLDILNEATPGLTIGIEDLAKANPDVISKIATKSDINVVDKIQEAGEVSELKDVTKDIIVKDRKIYILADVAYPGDEVEFTHKGKAFTAVVSNEPKGSSQEERLLKDVKQKKNAPTQATPNTNPVHTSTAPESDEEKVADTQQENAIYNLKNWATQLQIPIGDGDQAPNGSIKFTYFSQENQQPIIILVLSNGLIKMSGHDVSDYSDFDNIIKWHQANQ